jgi:hypothetical protein
MVTTDRNASAWRGSRAMGPTVLALGLLLPALLPAQAFLRVGAGATISSTLVGEVIQNPIALRPSLAPTVTALVGWRLANGYRVGVEARYATGTLEVHDDGSTASDDLTDLTTLELGVVADGPIGGAFRWEATVAMLRYRPADPIGPFREGSPAPLLLGAGVAWSHPLGTGLALVIGGRLDFHSFSTERLTREGYSSSQGVRRAGVTIALERSF